MQRPALFVTLIAFTMAGCQATVTTRYQSKLMGNPLAADNPASQPQRVESRAPLNQTPGSTQSTTNRLPTRRVQPAARVLVCAVTTTDALNKDRSRKPEHCRIFEVKTVAQAINFKCDRVYAVSSLFKDGNYSCEVSYLKCLPGTSCEFTEFPCNNAVNGTDDNCNGVKRIALVETISRDRSVNVERSVQ
ncbi:hypothetical protein J5X98_07510 [Leptothermofonsia sichuanensis E412]|uniref:hypothetical protein n=1 Tax=Leptothermofonsia sichuanensis TaxID=2917832 RepID=UPI001CA6E3B4|nr:hypothetical protein [Leptothermofonsia sichuanensis]QZZ22226.1 hypothetical protein J5X98_07510 [Leptothermofonsia sichuanensis E412]